MIRSILSVPGSSPRFIAKAETVPADVIAFDLEDSVAPQEKAAARAAVAQAVDGFPKDGRLVYVRPNDLDSGLLEDDLAAVVRPGLDGIHLPKVHRPATLIRVDHYLTLLERLCALPDGSIRMMAWIESAEGVANVEAICAASPRLVAVSVGSEDYAASLGVSRSASGAELAFARARGGDGAGRPRPLLAGGPGRPPARLPRQVLYPSRPGPPRQRRLRPLGSGAGLGREGRGGVRGRPGSGNRRHHGRRVHGRPPDLRAGPRSTAVERVRPAAGPVMKGRVVPARACPRGTGLCHPVRHRGM